MEVSFNNPHGGVGGGWLDGQVENHWSRHKEIQRSCWLSQQEQRAMDRQKEGYEQEGSHLRCKKRRKDLQKPLLRWPWRKAGKEVMVHFASVC